MINKVAFRLLAVAALLVPMGMIVAQEDVADDSFKTALQQETSQKLSAGEIAEIIEIRKRLGGGTGLELDEVLVNYTFESKENPDHYFQEMDEQDRLQPTVEAEKLFWRILDSSKVRFGKLVDQSVQPANSSPTGDQSALTVNPVDSMRSIAKRLDQLASEMEELNLFDQADEIRRQSNVLRERSRQHVRREAMDRWPKVDGKSKVLR